MTSTVSPDLLNKHRETVAIDPLVLNINDSDGNRELISTILSRSGMRVIEAIDGQSGLSKLSKQIDVIVLDVNLPDLDGTEVCRRIKTTYVDEFLPVMLVSAEAIATADRIQGLEGGADGYLTLPVEPRELVATVRGLARLRRAEQMRALQTRRAMLTADSVVAMNGRGDLSHHLGQYAKAVARHFAIDAVVVWLNVDGRMKLAAHAGDAIREEELIADLPADGILSGSDPTPMPAFVRGTAYDGPELARTEWLKQFEAANWAIIPHLAETALRGFTAVFSNGAIDDTTLSAIAESSSAVGLGIEKARAEQALVESEVALERITSAVTTSVTARAYGIVLLREASPPAFEEATQEFDRLLDLALEQRGYRIEHGIPEGLRKLGDRLALLRVGPRDVIDIYSTALKRKTASATGRKDHAYVEEGRLLVLELMGNLVSNYRASSVLSALGPVPRPPSRADGGA